jgi:hypothetical protein
VKLEGEDLTLFLPMTISGTAPLPGGTVTVMLVSEFIVMVAGSDPKCTARASVNPLPVMLAWALTAAVGG